MTRRVVVIGATGHIGTWLVPRLVRAGHDVVAVSRGSREPYQSSVEWAGVRRVVTDRHDDLFEERIAELAPEVVVDLICFDQPSAERLVRILRRRVEQLVHCGTLWVHGAPPACPYDETAPREPFGDYGIKKAEIERYLLDESSRGFPATILHPGHITGPGWTPINPAGHLTSDVFDRLARGDVVALPDDGSGRLQHVHVDDVAQAFELAVAQPEKAIGEAFHVAATEAVTMRDYADAVASWHGREANLDFLPWDQWKKGRSEREVELTWDHMAHSPCASVAKAQSILGFAPRYSAVGAVRNALGLD